MANARHDRFVTKQTPSIEHEHACATARPRETTTCILTGSGSGNAGPRVPGFVVLEGKAVLMSLETGK